MSGVDILSPALTGVIDTPPSALISKVKNVFQQMKKEKSPGNQLLAEMLEAGGSICGRHLPSVSVRTWKNHKLQGTRTS